MSGAPAQIHQRELILELQRVGAQPHLFTYSTPVQRLLLRNGATIDNAHLAVDGDGMLHVYAQRIQGGLDYERKAAEFSLDLVSGRKTAELSMLAPGEVVSATVDTSVLGALIEALPHNPEAALDGQPMVEMASAWLAGFQPGTRGAVRDDRSGLLLLGDDGRLCFFHEGVVEPVTPNRCWRARAGAVEFESWVAGRSPAVVTAAARNGGPILGRLRRLGPPEAQSVAALAETCVWLDGIDGGILFETGNMLGRRESLGRDPVPVLGMVFRERLVIADDGAPRVFALPNGIAAEAVKAAIHRSPFMDAAGRAPVVDVDLADGDPAILRLDEDELVIGDRRWVFSEVEVNANMEDGGVVVLNLEAGAGQVTRLAVSGPLAREIWRRSDLRAVQAAVAAGGIGSRYKHYMEVSRRRILFELFNDVMLLERDLNSGDTVVDLIRRFRDQGEQMDKALTAQVTDRLIALWLMAPNVRRRIHDILFYYPYFLTESQRKFDDLFLATERDRDVFDEGLSAQPMRSELQRAMQPLLQGLAELESSLAPVERLLSESRMRGTWQHKLARFLPSVGSGVSATTALVFGTGVAGFGMLAGVVASGVASQVLRDSMDDLTTMRQLTAATDRTLPAWTSLSQKIPVIMAETDAVLRRIQSAGMAHTRKLLDASTLPGPKKVELLSAALDAAIDEETENWFREVDSERGLYPAIASSAVSGVTADAARASVARARIMLSKSGG